jgi:hypothetical protein
MILQKKLTRTVLFFLFINLPYLLYSETGERFFETTGGFSICPPRNWNVIEFPGLKYKIIHTDPINGFSPNMTFVDEYYDGSLSEYMNLSNQNMKRIYPDAEYIRNESFLADSGLRGIKQVIINNVSGNLLRQSFYCFSNGKIKIIITCSVNNSNGQRYESIFDESVRTFDLIK